MIVKMQKRYVHISWLRFGCLGYSPAAGRLDSVKWPDPFDHRGVLLERLLMHVYMTFTIPGNSRHIIDSVLKKKYNFFFLSSLTGYVMPSNG